MGEKILLVDDNPLILYSIATALEADGYRVWVAESAEHALELAIAVGPDVVVTDFQLPGTDGVSLLSRLVASGRPVPRMYVYSAAEHGEGQLEEQLPRTEWIAKGVGHAALFAALKCCGERKHRTRCGSVKRQAARRGS